MSSSPSGEPCPLCALPAADCRLFCLDFRRGWRYWRCPRCRLSWRDPSQRPDRQRERAEYELHDNAADDPAYRAFLGRLSQPLLARLPDGAEGLDYGAGPEPVLAAMLEAAGHPMRIHDPFFHPDPSALDRRYDFITCSETAEHFFHPGREFRRLCDCLHAGGHLALMTGRLTGDERFARWRYRHDPTHVCFYRAETLEWIGAHYGFDIIYSEGDVTLFAKE